MPIGLSHATHSTMKSLLAIKATCSGASSRMPSLLLSAIVALGAGAALAEGPGDGSSGGDPTVGTLPLTGGEGVDLDQTLTLRGPADLVRAVVASADGDGGVEVIDLGGGDAWMRFYGDVHLALDLGILRGLELAIFGGFEGGGTVYAIETAEGMGSPFGLESGYSLDLEHGSLLTEGLLDEALDVHAFHRSGRRTRTQLQLDATQGTLLIRQQI